MNTMNRCATTGIIPVVVLERVEDAIPTAKALLEGGIDIMEITMRTAAGLDCIKAITETFPEILVGAGTVTTLDQCRACVDAGAKFIVSPGLNTDIVMWCTSEDIPVLPGCVTPSEIMTAIRLGVNIIKFFPANIYGGLSAMKALSGPFGSIRFVPTGGINAANLGEYIRAPFVHAVGGSWMCSKNDINSGNFEKITQLSAEATAIIASARPK